MGILGALAAKNPLRTTGGAGVSVLPLGADHGDCRHQPQGEGSSGERFVSF